LEKRLNNNQNINEIIHQRLRRVGEPLVTDAGLRDELNDMQAQQLLLHMYLMEVLQRYAMFLIDYTRPTAIP